MTFCHDHLPDDDGHAVTGQVRFHRPAEGGWQAAPLAEVPPLVFSEAMRDVDLFSAATSATSGGVVISSAAP